jgi:FtsP/CotA-like multicopper oxidase with cupredoxin domain
VSEQVRRLLNRRTFLKTLGVAAVGSAVGLEWASRQVPTKLLSSITAGKKEMHVGFTDGWVSMPQQAEALPPFWPDFAAPKPFNTYVFGIRDLTMLTEAQRADQRGHAQISAPVIFADENSDFRIHLHNLGEKLRPIGTPDNHTIHFHGFPNQIVYFDGVPDASLAAPPGRELIYRYVPEDPGTYMYHCHVDDVEHVHMGLTGLVFVRPALNQTNPGHKYAYNDPSTEYDREFAFLLTEMDVHGHFADAHQQDMDWSDFKPAFRLMNGRAWPDTIQPHVDPMAPAPALPPALQRLRYQPNSSLIQANAGERVLLRISNLGFEEHSLVLSGIPMRIVGRDAKPLGAKRPDYGIDGPAPGSRGSIETVTDRLDIGPGESRDVIFIAPPVSGGRQVYPFYDRNYTFAKTGSGEDGRDGIGGERTQVNVYSAGTLPPQTRPTGLYDPNTGTWTYASGTEEVPA